MHNYISYIPAGLNPRNRFRIPSNLAPKGMLDELSAPRSIGIWWLRSNEAENSYKVIGRSVVMRIDVTRSEDNEVILMHPDLSLSFVCNSTIAEPVNIVLNNFDLTGYKLPRISAEEHSLIAHAVNNSTPVSSGVTISTSISETRNIVDKSLSQLASKEFEFLLKNSINEIYNCRKKDSKNIISGVALRVIERLCDKGIDEVSAYDAAIQCDPLMAGVLPLRLESTLPQSTISSDSESDLLPPEVQLDQDGLVEEVEYESITDELLAPRRFSEPIVGSDGSLGLQRAEDVHQEILRKIVEFVRSRSKYDLRYNKYADLVLFDSDKSVPLHIMEIKSITSDNLEAQISKGIIQLARRQCRHGSKFTAYHLVVELSKSAVPFYLRSITDRLGIELHYFNNSLSGQESCQSLYTRLNIKNGRP